MEFRSRCANIHQHWGRSPTWLFDNHVGYTPLELSRSPLTILFQLDDYNTLCPQAEGARESDS
jgi:hypothetical protein